MLISDLIIEANEDVLKNMLDHRFVADIRSDRLPKHVFDSYLAYEGAFVETAIAIFSYACARAPDVATQRRLIEVLDALANTQVPFFEDVFSRRNIVAPTELPSDVQTFDRGMLNLAQGGSFTDIITAMFAAEWMYYTWCCAASRCPISDPDLKAWVDLHATRAFFEQAEWLKATIDATCDPSDVARLSEIFGRVTMMEIDFHTAAYGAVATPQKAS